MRIVYNAFNGRYADSPRALHQGLLTRGVEAEHVWLQDERFAGGFPAGVTTVPIGTTAAVAALESADVLISNTHQQLDTWTKPAGAFYLQTWHGTPLKRIHRAAATVPPEEMMVELDLDIASWDALVSQSPAATRLLRDAFAYTGPVLETGYPRNDVLNAPDAAERRAAVREELGIADDVTAVLYAPTYRDDTVDEADSPDGLDLAQLVAGSAPGTRSCCASTTTSTGARSARASPASSTCRTTPTSPTSTWPPTRWSPTTRRRCSTSR